MIEGRQKGSSRTLLAAPVAICILLAAALWLSLDDRKAVEQQVHGFLSVAADQNARSLMNWRAERLQHAHSILDTGPFVELLRKCLARTASSSETASVRNWMSAWRTHLNYRGIVLVDAQGRPVLSTGQADAPPGPLESLTADATKNGRAVSTDLTITPGSDTLWMAMALPLATMEGGSSGALIVFIDPGDFLAPLYKQTQTGEAAQETLLIRIDGPSVAVVTQNAQIDGALRLRRFQMGSVERIAGGTLRRTLDHRGIDCIFALQKLPESQWYVAAKMNYDEALGPANLRSSIAFWSTGLAALFLFFTVVHLSLRQHALLRLERQAASARSAVEDHHNRLAKYVNDSVFLADHQMRIVDANDRASEMYGYTRDELLTMSVGDLRDPSTSSTLMEHWEAAGRLGSLTFETLHRRKDGTSLPVEVSTRTLDVDGHQYRQSIIRDVTQRKAMEDKLQKALNEFSAVIAASPAAIISLGVDGNVKNWNAAAERWFGWTAEEVIGSPPPYVPPEAQDESNAIIKRVISGETITGLELRRVARDGSPRFLSLSVAPLLDKAGAPAGVMAVLLDVSREKHAERVLRESERWFRAAFEQAAVGMAHVAFDGSFIRVNRRLAEIAGYSIEELTTRTLPEVVFPADRACDEEDAGRLMAGEIETYSVEKRILRKNGDTLWVKLTASLVRSETGDPLHLSTVLEDVDQRRKAEKDSRESELKFRSVVENAPEGIYVRTNDGIVQYVNRTAVALFGAASDRDLIGTDVFERFHPDCRDAIRERFRRVEQGEMLTSSGDIWIRLDGTTFDTEVSAIPHTHEGREGALVFFRDVTRRKLAERERQRIEEQFHQAQKMESVGRLAGGVAHDFNNHLTVINGYCSVLLGRLSPDDPSREIVEQVLHAGERSADLIRQLLSFSRKQIVEPRPTDLNEAVAGLRKLLARLIGEDIDLVINAGANAGSAYIDPGQLNQILMNLAVNARDAMPSGGTLRIETSAVELDADFTESHIDAHAGTYVLLMVSDSGEGMTPETRVRIFEPFFTTKSGSAGTGLGLSTVYGIVRQAGGWIWVYSEPGKGSTFKVYLPRVESEPDRIVSEPVRLEDLRGTETILVVEDQDELRRFAVAVLNKFGYDVLEAADGQAALALCEELDRPLDMLVTDVIMPGMSGLVLARHITEAMPHLQVLYMSGYTANVIAQSGVLEPGLEYLAKPFTPDQLARKVRTVLDAARRAPTILVVDDQESVRGVMREVLKAAGFPILEAGDGRPAAQLIRDNPDIGLVITDLVMPDQEGLETIRLIKRERPEMKIIAVSGAFEGQFLRTATYFGADATMAKPIDGRALVDCVQALLRPPR